MIEQHSNCEVRQEYICKFLSQSENLWLIDEAFAFFKYIKQPANIHSVQYSNDNPPREILVQEKVAMFADKVLLVGFMLLSVGKYCGGTTNKTKYSHVFEALATQVQDIFNGKKILIDPQNAKFNSKKCKYYVYVLMNEEQLDKEKQSLMPWYNIQDIVTTKNSSRCQAYIPNSDNNKQENKITFYVNYLSYFDLIASAKKRNAYIFETRG